MDSRYSSALDDTDGRGTLPAPRPAESGSASLLLASAYPSASAEATAARWRAVGITGISGAIAWAVFAGYLQWAAPWIEGQSGHQVPTIDMLGVLRVEQPGQWISLFPPDAWQRDEQQRNLINANGNILMFQNYQLQDDGRLRVTGLTLLLFDDEANETAEAASESRLTNVGLATKATLPTVIESMDDAFLEFEDTQAVGMERYGDLKRIWFEGDVRFWKRGRTTEDAFELITRELSITGSRASTEADVSFRFGGTDGIATGLQLTFENPSSLHADRATVTEIQGIRHLRLGLVQRLTMRDRQAKAPLHLTCSGPAEFNFKQQYARFNQQVTVIDEASKKQIESDGLLIQFTLPEPTAATNSADKTRFVPTDWQPQDLWALGTPAIVSDPQGTLRLTAGVLRYEVTSEQFTAGDLPRETRDPWMTDLAGRYHEGVGLYQDGWTLRVPSLQYRDIKAVGLAESAPRPGLYIDAIGAGRLQMRQSTRPQPLEIKWRERLTVTPDPESNERWLVSLVGGTDVAMDRHHRMTAEHTYLWLRDTSASNPGATGGRANGLDAGPITGPDAAAAASGSVPRMAPDLLVAQGDVRFSAKRSVATVNEARVYFPPPQTSPLETTGPLATADPSGPTVAAQTVVGQSSSVPPPSTSAVSRVGFIESTPDSTRLDPTTREELLGPNQQITAHSLVVQLKHAVVQPNSTLTNLSNSPQAQSLENSSRYQVQSLDLQRDVEIRKISNQTQPINFGDTSPRDLLSASPGANPNAGTSVATAPADSTFRILGDRVVGVAIPSTEPPAKRDSEPEGPLFEWTLLGSENQPARLFVRQAQIQSPEMHFDQQRNTAWSQQPGLLLFDLPADAKSLKPTQSTTTVRVTPPAIVPRLSSGTAAPVASPLASTTGGKGHARWQRGMQFDGQVFGLDGDVQLELEQLEADGGVNRVQTYSDRVSVHLTQRWQMQPGQQVGKPEVERIEWQQAAPVNTAGPDQPVRLYHHELAADQTTRARQVLWGPSVVWNVGESRFAVSGSGTLWTIRQGDQTAPGEMENAATASQELTFLKVKFQRALNGDWKAGRYRLDGPVSVTYGIALDWQVMDNEQRLLRPVQLSSDAMTVNRWQRQTDAPFELEWEATGKVHVRGEQFEGTAQSLQYAQSQDLLTLKGDQRAPAKFWQRDVSQSGQRNHLAAQKIWYRPKQEDFHFEGFQEGNLNFFSGRKKPPGQ